jgi:hypothetical protein
VDDSLHADTADTAANADNATSADDADKLDGLDSTQFAGFGETTYVTEQELQPCDPTTRVELVASETFSVSRETLVYTSTVATYTPDETDEYSATMGVELVDASNGNLLASSGLMTVYPGDSDPFARTPITVQGVLNTGSLQHETPFVAAPGNQYKLRLLGAPTSTCVTDDDSDPLFIDIALTYLLIGKS